MENFFDEEKHLSSKVRSSRFYRNVKTESKREINKLNADGTRVQVSLNQKEYYTEEDIASFQLESYSKLIPDIDGYKLITSTYFVRFWGPVFDWKPKPEPDSNGKRKIVRRSGGMIAYTYLILKSYCWGKDHCWISMQTLADNLTVSRNAAISYVEELEKEGFVLRFWREADKNGEDESVLIKVRQTVPFLTKEKIDLLPKKLKDEHDSFLRSIRLESEKEFEDSYNYTEVYEELRSKTVEVTLPANSMTPYEQLMKKVTEKDKMTWNVMKERMKHYLQQESINQWFGNAIAYVDESRTLHVVTASVYQKEHVENKFKHTLHDVMNDILVPADKIVISTYEK